MVRSTRETTGTGTRIAVPSSLPLSCGITSPIAAAAPVEVGIILRFAARALREITVIIVVQVLVVGVGMNCGHEPAFDPKASLSTLATGAKQLVVQPALETTKCLLGS